MKGTNSLALASRTPVSGFLDAAHRDGWEKTTKSGIKRKNEEKSMVTKGEEKEERKRRFGVRRRSPIWGVG